MGLRSLYFAVSAFTTFITPLTAQTYSQCNPLTGGSCPPNPALGKAVKVDFTSGQSDSFTATGNPTYNSNGASLTVAKDGDSPTLASKWYIMFGHVDFVVKAAPGTGIVSSCVLQSDDLDEIDWEWLGGDNGQVQSNYFGQGKTLNYNRGAFHPAAGNHDGFKTYSIDWTADQVVWSIDGQTVRVLSSSTASQYPYPQTPMMIKVGAWCGGCSSNAPGTIQWAGGPASFSGGGYAMQVKSISATDYSTGTQYKYSGTDGTWQSIQAVGGTVNPKGGKASVAVANAPQVSTTSNTGPMPFSETRKQDSSSSQQPNAGSWSPTTLQTTTSPTTYPGLPAGWTVTSSGKVLPPSAAPQVTPPPSSPSSSQQGSQQGSQNGGSNVAYDGQGFAVNLPNGAAKKYDDKGFLILDSRASPSSSNSPAGTPAPTPDTPVKALAAQSASTSATSALLTKSTSTPSNAVGRVFVNIFSVVAFSVVTILII